MNVVTLVVSIACALAGLLVGLAFGTMPLRSGLMTEQQRSWQQWWGIGFVLVVLGLMVTRQDVPSWTILIAAVVGVAVARIPPLHRAMIGKFPAFAPKTPVKQSDVNSPKPGRKSKRNHVNRKKKHR
ncbi:hypothetical protein GA0061078_0482 [Bifidobacterium bohemicum]|uniref:Uncharacterized protein n=1 Tax=Bifidobacterium bohemicum DSM 22767 TaxID=1437606 RepID=A0A086ZJM9_9BIFI|nr:hypothetical protein [Bifidobacterium bohemicum]KFI46729.1 hypothetical protein BBOH_0201 [Bifidobacterium bohemicum DSM 22767]SCB79985.1 hypothetical protein GA0061078_0482 [Bifidobacterium bohemicum]